MTLEEARKRGYCVTSRNSLLAARIDREDWLDHMNSTRRLKFKRNADAASWYRRCVSKDSIVIPRAWLKQLQNSDDPQAPMELRT